MTERPKIPTPEMIIHGPLLNEKAQLCKMVDSSGKMHDGILMQPSPGLIAKIPASAVIMEAERLGNTPVSIVTEASKIDLSSSGKPALYNSQSFLDSWDRTFGKNKQMDS